MLDPMSPDTIVNEALVKQALDLTERSIINLFGNLHPRTTWGPQYLVLVVRHPSLPIPVIKKYGRTDNWKEEWGAISNTEAIAHWKAEAAQRENKPTSELTFMCPWDHNKGDFLYPGGVVSGKLSVGASGLEGFADEIAANLVLVTIQGLCKLKREQLRASKVKLLG